MNRPCCIVSALLKLKIYHLSGIKMPDKWYFKDFCTEVLL
jgi:hypothetical protein